MQVPENCTYLGKRRLLLGLKMCSLCASNATFGFNSKELQHISKYQVNLVKFVCLPKLSAEDQIPIILNRLDNVSNNIQESFYQRIGGQTAKNDGFALIQQIKHLIDQSTS